MFEETDSGFNMSYDIWTCLCDVTLSVYPHRAGLKNMPGHGGKYWASIPKVIGSIPTVARHIFQACPVWIYTQSNISHKHLIHLSTLHQHSKYHDY